MLLFSVMRLKFASTKNCYGAFDCFFKILLATCYKIHLLSNRHAGVIIKAFLGKLCVHSKNIRQFKMSVVLQLLQSFIFKKSLKNKPNLT